MKYFKIWTFLQAYYFVKLETQNATKVIILYEHYSADSYLLVVDNMLRKDLQ